MLFCFPWVPEPWQSPGTALPQFPIRAPCRTQPFPSPSPAQGLPGFCSVPPRIGSVSVLSPGFTGAPGWMILFLGPPGVPGIWELGSASQFLIQHP